MRFRGHLSGTPAVSQHKGSVSIIMEHHSHAVYGCLILFLARDEADPHDGEKFMLMAARKHRDREELPHDTLR